MGIVAEGRDPPAPAGQQRKLAKRVRERIRLGSEEEERKGKTGDGRTAGSNPREGLVRTQVTTNSKRCSNTWLKQHFLLQADLKLSEVRRKSMEWHSQVRQAYDELRVVPPAVLSGSFSPPLLTNIMQFSDATGAAKVFFL